MIPQIQEMRTVGTSFGTALYIRVATPDYRPLGWREIYDAYTALYPDRWAVQFFPPADELVDQENLYHLYVLYTPPRGVNIHPRTWQDRLRPARTGVDDARSDE